MNIGLVAGGDETLSAAGRTEFGASVLSCALETVATTSFETVAPKDGNGVKEELKDGEELTGVGTDRRGVGAVVAGWTALGVSWNLLVSSGAETT